MKQSLHLQLGQHLTLTPQLQHAIRLLQLSSIDLQHEIEQALESNPMLETQEELQQAENTNGNGDAKEVTSAEIDDFPYDAMPQTHYNQNNQVSFTDNIPENIKQDLHHHLNAQLALTHLSRVDKEIAEALVDAIADDGFLTTPLEDICETVKKIDNEADVESDDVEAVLYVIQNLEPLGVGSRNIQESLLIQLRNLPQKTTWKEQALQIVEHHFDELSHHNFNKIMHALHLKKTDFEHSLALIQSLKPRPGLTFDHESNDYIVPDLVVRKHRNQWQVQLNDDVLPHLRINQSYANLIKRADNGEDNTFLKNYFQEAKWFIKSIQSRNETLLKVSTAIMKRQHAFLEHGEEKMVPLILKDIAKEVDMHESTISRVTTNKYILTPQGLYELKFFFSSHVSTMEGKECSSTAIRARIKKIIEDEHPDKPLSDNCIANMLQKEGVRVARRTVAKYREALNIPPSFERKLYS